ncbi:hypothetical protein V1517DRAFT_331629 [Lipomyces orientalis]|uniref:Uncharacterized protein n=1 Tax=Lipomyces orientalis TaxID=1233043 RepID=A0ACC3TEX6_9ASCO
MSPPSGGVLVKNEIQPRKPTNSTTSTTDAQSEDEPQQQRKRPRVPEDPYASVRTQLSSLVRNPHKEIVIPRPKSPSEMMPPPPELVTNVQGSSAGAGSGEFHVYKQARRREMERTRLFDEQREKEKTQKEFTERREQMKALDEGRTNKKREKRRKRGKSGKRDDKPVAVNNDVEGGTEEAGEQQQQDQLPDADSAESVPADHEIKLTIIDEFA